MTTERLADAIAAEEGLRLIAYPDPLSGGAPFTIGYGHTGPEVKPGLSWTLDQAQRALKLDIAAACRGLDRLVPWWRDLDDVRQDALAQMSFQLGAAGVLAFRRTLTALRDDDFSGAAASLGQSLWARQTPARAGRVAALVRTGAYPTPFPPANQGEQRP